MRGLKSFIYKLLVGGVLFSAGVSLQASWNPGNYIGDSKIKQNRGKLHQKKYKMLKRDVLFDLKQTLISREKIRLLMDLTLMTRPEVCVEIGAFTGLSVLPVAATLQYLGQGKIFAVDAWSNEIASLNLEDNDPMKPWWSQVDMVKARQIFNQRMSTWLVKDFCTPVRKSSQQVKNKFDKIDFLHLDGDYSEVGSLADAKLYVPKVKKGGYILLSNLSIAPKGKQSKMKTFHYLLESSEIVTEIEHFNTILFRKK